MKVHKWRDVAIKRLGAEEYERLRTEARAELAIEMNLPELRQALGKTQVEVAEAAEMAQAKVSQFERRDDHLLSVLRRYIEALGGELEISAIIGGKRIKLKGL